MTNDSNFISDIINLKKDPLISKLEKEIFDYDFTEEELLFLKKLNNLLIFGNIEGKYKYEY